MMLTLSDDALATILDALLPGDDRFPPASTTGIAATVRRRLAQLGGDETESRLAAALLSGDLAALERDKPVLFDLLRRAAFLAYYEAPAVIAAIQAGGTDYRGAPQPRGYDMAPFDPKLDAPTHRRGAWKTTAETEHGGA